MNKINIGDKFGRLTVVRETTKEERINPSGRNYECICECGNKKIIYGHNLKTGHTKSCGCLSREIASKNNSTNFEPGTQFGLLTIIERAPIRHTTNHQAYWKCKCQCGNIIEVSSYNLSSGITQSCGCLRKQNTINEIGNKYGELTVIEATDSRSNGGVVWLCQCSCGNYVEVRGDSLRSGHTKSCGCIKSYKEKEINELLNKYNISYSTQICFSDLKTDKGGYLRFDFAIYNSDKTIKYLIEYQGSQHTDINNNWYSIEYQQRDQLKSQYCQQHNLSLLIWDKNTNIEEAIKGWYIE